MKLEDYIRTYINKKPIIKCSEEGFTVRLLGEEVLIDGRKSRTKALKGNGDTPKEAFENALKILN